MPQGVYIPSELHCASRPSDRDMARKEIARKQSKQQEEPLIMPDHQRKDSQPPQANAVAFGAAPPESNILPPNNDHPDNVPRHEGPGQSSVVLDTQTNTLSSNNVSQQSTAYPSNAPPRVLQRPSNASPPLTNFPTGYNQPPQAYHRPSIWGPRSHLSPSNYGSGAARPSIGPPSQYSTYPSPYNNHPPRRVSGSQQAFYTPPGTATSNASFGPGRFGHHDAAVAPLNASLASLGANTFNPPHSATSNASFVSNPFAQAQPHPPAAVFDQPASFDSDQVPPLSDISTILAQLQHLKNAIFNFQEGLRTPVSADYEATREREAHLGWYLRELMPGLAALSQDASAWLNEVMGCNDAGVRVNVGGRGV